MNGNSLLMLSIMLMGCMPTLGFFSPGGVLILLFLLFFIIISYCKSFTLTISRKTVFVLTIFLLLYGGYFYGGFYQSQFSKAIGQIIYFLMTAFIIWQIIIRKRAVSPWFLIFIYILLGVWTLISSPNPHVDTVVIFREAPLKLLHGINPYDTTYTRVYKNISPDYYSHLPISFLFYVPFLLFPVDPRFVIMGVTICTFLALYHRVKASQKSSSVLPLSLILFMPGSFYMIEHQFHEPIIFFFFAMATYMTPVSERLYYLFLSLFFNVKQNIIVALPFFITRKIWSLKNLVLFIIPFFTSLLFFLWNPTAFLEDVLFVLKTNEIPSPVHMSLALPTLIRYLLPGQTPLFLIQSVSFCLFISFYYFVFRSSKMSSALKTGLIIFASYFFSYYAFFNSYYLVFLFLLFDFVRSSYFPAKYTNPS